MQADKITGDLQDCQGDNAESQAGNVLLSFPGDESPGSDGKALLPMLLSPYPDSAPPYVLLNYITSRRTIGTNRKVPKIL